MVIIVSATSRLGLCSNGGGDCGHRNQHHQQLCRGGVDCCSGDGINESPQLLETILYSRQQWFVVVSIVVVV